MRVLQIVFGVSSFCCFAYYIVIISYAGFQKGFSPFWLSAGIGTMGASILLWWLKHKDVRIPIGVQAAVYSVLGLGILVFAVILTLLLHTAGQSPEEGADYVIVLGTQVKGSKVSRLLSYRLDAAYDYLVRNPGTKVIVAGGQGDGEDISEAEAMEGYLAGKGIDVSRIIKEDRSTTTVENIAFSKELMEAGTHRIVVATNDFHVFRGVRIAKKQLSGTVTGLPGRNDAILSVSMYVREVMAVFKDFLFGNL